MSSKPSSLLFLVKELSNFTLASSLANSELLSCFLSIAAAIDLATLSSTPFSINSSTVVFWGVLFASSKAFILASNSLFFFSASFLAFLSLFIPLLRLSFSSSSSVAGSVFVSVSCNVSASTSSTSGKAIPSCSCIQLGS